MPATYIQTDGSRADVPLNEPRVRVRIKSRVTQGLGPHLVRRKDGEPPHWQEFVISRSLLAQAQALVEKDHERIESAKRDTSAKYAGWISDHGGNESATYNEKTWGGSIEKTFFENNRRGILPFIAIEVIEDNLPPPLMPLQVGISNREMTSNHEAILAELKALRQQSDKQQKVIASLQNQLSTTNAPKRIGKNTR